MEDKIVEVVELQKLDIFDFRTTVKVGWNEKELPEATSSNMKVLMDKINELIIEVKELKSKLE